METLRSSSCVAGTAAAASHSWRVAAGSQREHRARARVSGESPASSHWPGPHRSQTSTTTSDQTRRPAEFKHITKRRKRN